VQFAIKRNLFIALPNGERIDLVSVGCISCVYPKGGAFDAGPSGALGQQPRAAHSEDIARQAGLREGARVDVEAQGGRIIISLARPRYVLADMLKGMTPEAMREGFDWDPTRDERSSSE
jgi:antitoxin component of MazEF toxin-antitoxin module